MNEEEKTHDTETEIIEIFGVPRLKERKNSCLPKDNFIINLLYLYIAIIFYFIWIFFFF